MIHLSQFEQRGRDEAREIDCVRLGTRGSRLALWQAQCVAGLLSAIGLKTEIVQVDTLGDRDTATPLNAFGHGAPFADEIEQALLRGDIDVAVHSYKDMAATTTPGTVVAAVPLRGDPHDVIVARDGRGLAELPARAVFGTCSARRTVQLRRLRPDLEIRPVRGAVPQRVAQLMDGAFDAIVLAAAGLQRLGMCDVISEYLSIEQMVPAPAQAALAVQVRASDERRRRQVARIDVPQYRTAVELERRVLAAFEPFTPFGAAYATCTMKGENDYTYSLHVRELDEWGKLLVDQTLSGSYDLVLANALSIVYARSRMDMAI